MTPLRFILGLTVSLLCLPSAARAILIEAGNARVGGYLVRDDGKKLTIRTRTASGAEKETEYDRSKVKIKVLHQLDRKRLEGLANSNPKAYRDYAEELAGQEDDPEARDTAMRLFLTAAYLDPKEHGHKCLLRMSKLASSPAEARKCRAMAFLLDARSDVSLLKSEAAGKALPKVQASSLQDFLRALYLYRTGQIAAAKELSKREGLDKVFTMAPGMVDQKTFLQRCNDAACTNCKTSQLKGKIYCNACGGKGGTLGAFGAIMPCTTCNGTRIIACTSCEGLGYHPSPSDDVLRVVLRAELWALNQLAGSDAAARKTSDKSWSSIIESRQTSPVSTLSLETMTEFDPRKCLYRNGAWVAPDK